MADESTGVNALITRGTELTEEGDLDGGLACLDEALKADPESAFAWFSRGCVLGKLGRHREAVTAYLRCTELAPDRAMPWYNMGNQLQALGAFDQAIECFEM